MGRNVRTSLNQASDDAFGTRIATLDALPQRTPIEIEAVLVGATDAVSGGSRPDTQVVDSDSLIVYRDGDDVRAWHNVCPHAGRRLDWAPGKFLLGKDGLLICAVHGATFELQRGECVAGPCRGQSLRAVAVAIVDGEVGVSIAATTPMV